MGLAPGQPTARRARVWPARWPGALRAWPVWGLQTPLRGYVIAVIALGAAALGAAAAVTPWRSRDAVMYAILLAFGAVTAEALRRMGEPAGASKDAHGLWELSVAVLLPPFYAIAAPVMVAALAQWRVRRTIAHRRVFSAAAVGLSYGAASLAFHAAWPGTGRLPGSQAGLLAWGLLAAGCALLRWIVNNALVLTALRLGDPAARIRDLLGGRRALCLDAAEMCVGVLIAFAAALGPVLLIFALPCGVQLQRAARRAQLMQASRSDPKTGLLSAVTWQREAVVQIARAVRTATPLAVAIVDIDHFTTMTETYGRMTGDRVICEAAQTLASAVHEADIPGRFRGEEFVLLLSGAGAAEAMRVAERLRSRLSDIVIPGGAGGTGGPGEPPRITVSIGVAALGDTTGDLTELLAAADAALHWAKSAGCNTVWLRRPAAARGLTADRAVRRRGRGR